MSGTSRRSFEFARAATPTCRDWVEFDQAAYVKECLHASEQGRPTFASGVCAALSVLVLSNWLNTGCFSKQLVDEFVLDCNDQNTGRTTPREVLDLTTSLEDGRWQDTIEAAVQDRTGLRPQSSDFFVEPEPLIDELVHPKRDQPALLAFGGLASVGHASVVRPDGLTFFDPNVGYYQASGNRFQELLEIWISTPRCAVTVWWY